MFDPSDIQWLSNIIFLIIGIFFFQQVFSQFRKGIPTEKKCRTPCFFSLPVLIVLVLIGYQAKWQIFGFLDPGFLRVQRGFDPRGDLIGERFKRGSIIDMSGRELARDIKTGDNLRREYLTGDASVHLLGYHHPVFGSTGLEKELDSRLMGRRVRNFGDMLRLLLNGLIHKRLEGNPVRLTISGELQVLAHRLLGNRRGAIVGIDPESGAVRLLVSAPAFDPNNLTSARFDELRCRSDSPFLNRVTHGLYPPGSTFKSLIALKALEMDIQKKFSCGVNGFDCGPGEPPIHDYQYYLLKNQGEVYKGHGVIDLDQALIHSCNVYFANLGQTLGFDEIAEIADRAGVASQLQAVEPGLDSREGYFPFGDVMSLARVGRLAIGQDDILMTPMHLAMIIGALGSGGTVYHPKFLQEAPSEVWRQLTTHRFATMLSRKLIAAVEFGTGKAARIPGIIIGGKTGTAENASGQSHAVFIGFAPWPKPRLALCIVIEQAGWGGKYAAPIASELFVEAEAMGLFEDEDTP